MTNEFVFGGHLFSGKCKVFPPQLRFLFITKNLNIATIFSAHLLSGVSKMTRPERLLKKYSNLTNNHTRNLSNYQPNFSQKKFKY